MKVRTLLFALYILLVAVFPCNDQDTCVDEQRRGFENIATDDHDHGAGETDHCSPFCVCSCCATTMQITTLDLVMPACVTHNTALLIPYRQRSLSASAHAVWQPPRIS